MGCGETATCEDIQGLHSMVCTLLQSCFLSSSIKRELDSSDWFMPLKLTSFASSQTLQAHHNLGKQNKNNAPSKNQTAVKFLAAFIETMTLHQHAHSLDIVLRK